MADETVFREKSIERLSSPDRLNDYVKLADPGVWFILAAIVMILTGACIFGVFGHLDSTVPGVGIVNNGKMVCLVKKEYAASLRSDKPVTVGDTTDGYALYLGNMQPGEWVYEIDVGGDFADGNYEADLVTDEISPLSFLFGPDDD